MKQYAGTYLLVFNLLIFNDIFTGKPGPFSCISFHIQSEVTNSLRLYLLINTICPDLFRDILSHFVSTAQLPYERLKDDEYWISAGDLNWFYNLLRDICNISPHKNGWGNPPESKDNSASACIERIQIKSKEITFPGDVSYQRFEENWKNLRNDITEIERQVLDGHLYEKRIDDFFSTDTYFVKNLASRLRPLFYSESGKNISINQYALRAWYNFVLMKN